MALPPRTRFTHDPPTIYVEGVLSGGCMPHCCNNHSNSPGGEGHQKAMPIDKYVAGIELSNACRQFYVSKVKAAAKVKERLGLLGRLAGGEGDPAPGQSGTTLVLSRTLCPAPAVTSTTTTTTTTNNNNNSNSNNNNNNNTATTNTIDSAMEVLKRELTLLMDQDLELMGQLLTLNERIEELKSLKWQRRICGYSRGSLESSCNLDVRSHSLCSSSETCMNTLDVKETMVTKYPSPSNLSLYSEHYGGSGVGVNSDTGGGGGGLSARNSEERELPVPPEAIHLRCGTTIGMPVVGMATSLGERDVVCGSASRRLESTSDLGSSDDVGLTQSRGSLTTWLGQPNCGGQVRGVDLGSTHLPVQAGVSHHTRGSQDQQSFDSGIHNPEPGDLIEIMI